MDLARCGYGLYISNVVRVVFGLIFSTVVAGLIRPAAYIVGNAERRGSGSGSSGCRADPVPCRAGCYARRVAAVAFIGFRRNMFGVYRAIRVGGCVRFRLVVRLLKMHLDNGFIGVDTVEHGLEVGCVCQLFRMNLFDPGSLSKVSRLSSVKEDRTVRVGNRYILLGQALKRHLRQSNDGRHVLIG